MDETAVQHEYEARKGFVIDMNQQERSAAGCFFSPLKMAKTRAHTTYVAFITDNILVQRYLPQFVLPNKNRTTRAEMDALKALPDPIITLEESNGWVNIQIMCDMITELRRRVRAKVGATATVVLFMDGASQHISNEVLTHAARLQVIVVLIPSQLTWLLQPLDVECFRGFKDLLRLKQLEARLESLTASVAVSTRIQLLGETIREHFIEQPFAQAFRRTGIWTSHSVLKNTIARFLLQAPPIVARALTQEEMIVLVGRERAGIAERFFRAPQNHIRRHIHLQAAIMAGPAVAAMAHEEPSAPDSLPVGLPLPPVRPPAPPPEDPPPPSRRSLPESLIARRTRSRVSLPDE